MPWSRAMAAVHLTWCACFWVWEETWVNPHKHEENMQTGRIWPGRIWIQNLLPSRQQCQPRHHRVALKRFRTCNKNRHTTQRPRGKFALSPSVMIQRGSIHVWKTQCHCVQVVLHLQFSSDAVLRAQHPAFTPGALSNSLFFTSFLLSLLPSLLLGEARKGSQKRR